LIISQLIAAATSVGANLEEAVAGQSRADFIHKNAISLKEARESNYWLRLIVATESFKPPVKKGILELVNESCEISKIIAKRIISSKVK
jgi:four helix bundle protein